MPMNPATDQIVHSVREHLAAHPVGDLERVMVARIVDQAQVQLPLPREVLGEAFIQFASMMRTLIPTVRDAEREAGRFLRAADEDSTSIDAVAGNLVMLAGIELYTGTDL